MMPILVLYIISFFIMIFVIRYMKKIVGGSDYILITLFKILSFIPIVNTFMSIIGMMIVFIFSLSHLENARNPFHRISQFLWGD